MRNLRKVVLLAVAAMTVVAFAASSASAALSVTAETGGGSCSAVAISGTNVTGGCLIHARSELGNGVVLRKHVFGIESVFTTCDNEFHGRVNAAAVGYVFEQTLTGAGCNRQACAGTAGERIPWAANGTEAPVLEGNEYLTTNFCLEPVGGGADESCEIDVPFEEAPAEHSYEFGHASEFSSHGVSGFRCELVGHWNTEVGGAEDGTSEATVEVNHA